MIRVITKFNKKATSIFHNSFTSSTIRIINTIPVKNFTIMNSKRFFSTGPTQNNDSSSNNLIPNTPISSSSSSLDTEDNESTQNMDKIQLIKQILEEKISPALQSDGGDIEFDHFDENTGMVHVSLTGACASCDRSTITMRMLVNNALKHYLPFVKGVVRVEGIPEHEIKYGDDKCLF